MTAEILRHSEAIGYDAFVVPAMLLEAWVAERRNEPGAAEDAYRRVLELAGRIGFVDHVSFALARLGANALARGDPGQAEELCRRALAMAEAASTSRLAAHARVQLARVLEAAGAAGREAAGPRRRDRSARPRLARPPARGGCDDLSDAEAAAAGGRGRGRRDRDPRRRSPHPCGVAAAQPPGACWACRGSASPGHGSRVAAASVSVAGKRRRAERAGGDGW